MRYYLEQRDPDFAEKMAEVLCVYRQVKILSEAAFASMFEQAIGNGFQPDQAGAH